MIIVIQSNEAKLIALHTCGHEDIKKNQKTNGRAFIETIGRCT